MHNLVGEEECAGLLRECREKLEAWQYQTGDTWLYKDGVSATKVEKFRKFGLKLPDRFELDLKNPGTNNVKEWEPPDVDLMR